MAACALPGSQQKQDLEALRHRLGLSSSHAADSSQRSTDGPPSLRSFHTASTSGLEVQSLCETDRDALSPTDLLDQTVACSAMSECDTMSGYYQLHVLSSGSGHGKESHE